MYDLYDLFAEYSYLVTLESFEIGKTLIFNKKFVFKILQRNMFFFVHLIVIFNYYNPEKNLMKAIFSFFF